MGLPGGRGGHRAGPGGCGEPRQKVRPMCLRAAGPPGRDEGETPRRPMLGAARSRLPRALGKASRQPKPASRRKDMPLALCARVLTPAQNEGSDLPGSWEQLHPNSHLCPHPWSPSPLPARHGPRVKDTALPLGAHLGRPIHTDGVRREQVKTWHLALRRTSLRGH